MKKGVQRVQVNHQRKAALHGNTRTADADQLCQQQPSVCQPVELPDQAQRQRINGAV